MIVEKKWGLQEEKAPKYTMTTFIIHTRYRGVF
jgi:hypothetical protein